MTYLIILNVIVVSRLPLIFKDRPVKGREVALMVGFQLLALPFLEITVGWGLFIVYLILHGWLFYLVERKGAKLYRNRILFFLLHMFVLLLLIIPWFHGQHLRLAEWLFYIMSGSGVGEYIWDGSRVLLGVLLLITEVNMIVRYFFDLLRLKPLKEDKEVDEDEYNTGRIIGILERIFVFFFVLFGQYTALGFILAAKGLTRFHDFDDRTFAEYVLIGTLLSTLFSMLLALLLKTTATGF